MAGSNKKVIYAALVGNGLIAITKFIAGAMTNSSAMLSEAIHSVVDTGNQVLLLWGLKKAAKPADERFPFGHGKEIYFWSFIVAMLIFAVGAAVSIYKGIQHVIHSEPINSPMINYIVLALAMLFEGAAWYFAFREFTKAKGKWGYYEAVRRGKDPTMFVVLFEDSAAMIGLIVAFLGVWLSQATGIHQFDGAASIVIGLVLAGTAAWLAYETKSLLIGESANQHVIEGIRKIVREQPDVQKVNEVLTMHMGPEFILLNISVEFRNGETTDGLESRIAKITGQIRHAYPFVKRVFIEAERHTHTQEAPARPA